MQNLMVEVAHYKIMSYCYHSQQYWLPQYSLQEKVPPHDSGRFMYTYLYKCQSRPNTCNSNKDNDRKPFPKVIHSNRKYLVQMEYIFVWLCLTKDLKNRAYNLNNDSFCKHVCKDIHSTRKCFVQFMGSMHPWRG